MATVIEITNSDLQAIDNENLYALVQTGIVRMEKLTADQDEYVYLDNNVIIYKRILAGYGFSVTSKKMNDFTIGDMLAYREFGFTMAWEDSIAA